MENESPLASQTRTDNHKNQAIYNSCQSKFKDFTRESSFRSMNRPNSVPGLLPGNIRRMETSIQTSKIVNRALEVMSKSLNDTDYNPQKPMKSVDDGDTSDESETAHSPSDSSGSDNDTEVAEPSRLGNLKAQLSFRKIAKKRRKAGGQSSFHHTKSSKEYLRKAQEAYQRLMISEQQQQKDQNRQPDLETSRDTVEKSSSSSPINAKESEAIDYGYGDTSSSKENKDEVDYGYGDPKESQPDNTVDYGYGDPDVQPRMARRREKPRRRNSVTKYSQQAANVVAAQAAAARILKLKPTITSTSGNPSFSARREQLREKLEDRPQRWNPAEPRDIRPTFTARREQLREKLEERPQRWNPTELRDIRARRTGNITAMQTSLQKEQAPQDQENKVTERVSVDRLGSPKRPSRLPDRDSVMQSPRLQVTSDYFSTDAKPESIPLNDLGKGNVTAFSFSKPARTTSWLSNDTLGKTTDDDDDHSVDSLASDMESLCSIRDTSYNSNHALKSADMPPVLPGSDRRSRFVGGRTLSGDMLLRGPLVVSFSNSSNSRRGSLAERRNSNDFSILPPPVGVVTTNGSASTSCMPAPVRRTPSFKGAQKRHD